ncbi:hypothetical protein [Glaciimonas immobilis]|uniref:Uncharacterized protein n=1 Tax=Glaciimonas immobilis TaxID=728004 RepID=A0A840RQD7_9BURK|nr:hypothetical protein [Glaciimonas immobilis]KAF3997103.1 hypothetical protein HAV38_15685 [Glaciimonas immobilis]MBB5199965.1 hypothetical protein [Glaciimonas immobilis]
MEVSGAFKIGAGAVPNRVGQRNFSRATPSEAGRFGVDYVKAHITKSVNLEILLRGECPEELKKQQLDLYRSADTYEKPVNEFTTDDFMRLTSAVLSEKMGNCGDLCMIAARAIVENGYPHPVQLCSIKGTMEGLYLNHIFVRICGSPQDKKVQHHLIDPFLQMLSPSEQQNLIGTTQPKTFAEPEYFEHLYCYATNDQTGKARLLSVPEISDFFSGSVGTVSLTSDKKIQFVSALSSELSKVRQDQRR